MQEKAISFASACNYCCPQGRESIDHVLATRNIVAQIWDRVSKLLNVPYLFFATWKARFLAWMLSTKKVSLYGTLTGMILCIITWCLWNSRCKAKMDGLKANTEQVWRLVKTWLKILATKLKVHKKLYAQDVHLLNEFNL